MNATPEALLLLGGIAAGPFWLALFFLLNQRRKPSAELHHVRFRRDEHDE